MAISNSRHACSKKMPAAARFYCYLALLCAVILPVSAQPPADSLLLGDFASGQLSEWQPRQFDDKKPTNYRLTQMAELIAVANAAASGLVYKQRIDLQATPWLNWSWRINQYPAVPSAAAERSKAGDDFAARIYVIIDGGMFPWRSRVLNYVATSQHGAGQSWASPYSDRIRMVALRSQSEHALGKWFIERRNVLADLRAQFGRELRYIDAVAIMVDSDDSQSRSAADYRQPYFSAR